jgi:cytoskeletal protein CcmA (bactofilin family)
VSYFSQPKTGREKGRESGTAAEVSPSAAAPAPAAVRQTTNDTVSTFGPGTLITGNIVCDGAMQIFGRVMGDTQAAQILVGDGAQVEGNLTAHEVTISGSFKGTVRAHNVKLKGTAQIEGEIFSKSLTVEENVQFEGMSRRLDKPIELQSSSQASSSAYAAMPQAASSAPANGPRPFSVAAAANPAPMAPAASTPGSFSQAGA